MNLVKILSNKFLTTLLSSVVIILVLLAILLPIAENVTTEVNSKSNDFEKKESSLIFSFPYKITPQEIITDNVEDGADSVDSDNINYTTKPIKIEKDTIIDNIPDEVFISNTDERDAERILLIDLLSERISEYFFVYNELPKLYSNKSKLSLSENPSHYVYFYNDDENKTNALTFDTGSDNYLMKQVSSCENNSSQNELLSFVYSDTEIILCKENGGLFKSPILN